METTVFAGRVIPKRAETIIREEAAKLYADDRDRDRMRESWMRGAACGYCRGANAVSTSPQAIAYRRGHEFGLSLLHSLKFTAHLLDIANSMNKLSVQPKGIAR